MEENDSKGKEKSEENMFKLFIEIPLEIAYKVCGVCESEREHNIATASIGMMDARRSACIR